jgi:amidase
MPIHHTADGVPVGVQLVGPPGRDDLVLSVAAQVQAAAGAQVVTDTVPLQAPR